MSTTIHSTSFKTPLEIERMGSDVDVSLRDAGTYTITDFIAAVETELNGIFIPRDELPEVEDGSTGHIIAGVIELSRTSDPAALRAEALRYLAAAEYIEEHPPVDEQQVEALTKAFMDAGMRISTTDGVIVQDYARRLIATGKVTVSTD